MTGEKRNRVIASAALCLYLLATPSGAQEMLRGVDLAQPAYSQAELTREAIEAILKGKASGDARIDLSGKSLNGLDLSGLDLSGTRIKAERSGHAGNVNFAKLLSEKAL